MKILFIDIETRPNLAYVWRLYDENVGLEQLIKEHEVLCFAARWYNDPHMFFYAAKDGEGKMIEEAWNLLNEADTVVTYSGKWFDLTHLNRKFLQFQMGPPAPYQQVDLKDVVKRQFNFPSNKLDAVAQSLGLGRKVEHEGFRLWRRVMEGDPKAWEIMERYNKQDVRLLVSMYDRLRAWVPSHPVSTLYNPATNLDKCPVCGKGPVQSRGEAYTRLSVYKRYHCQNCKAWLRGKKTVRGATLRSI